MDATMEILAVIAEMALTIIAAIGAVFMAIFSIFG
jgi:hypothetical protein